jgi:hypothetical protein
MLWNLLGNGKGLLIITKKSKSVTTKSITYLGINWLTDNYEMLLKDIREKPSECIERINS